MTSNIGQIVDFMLPYTSQMRIGNYHDQPFLKAAVSNREMISKGYIYVLQTSQDKFAYIDSDCVTSGLRFFPQDIVTKPFIMERDYIHQKFGGNQIDPSWYVNMSVDVPYNHMIRRIIERMEFYDVIRYKSTSGTMVLESMDINSTRIRRAIERAFQDAGRYTGSISDLIDIVCIEHTPFQLTGLKEKELECVQKRLKSVGIITTIDDDSIVSIYFERK